MRMSRFIAAVLILLAGIGANRRLDALVSQATGRSETGREKFENFPLRIGKWRVETIPLTKRQLYLLKVDDYLRADFVSDEGARISVYVGYYADPARAAQHPPTICYPGSGWTKTYEAPTVLRVAGFPDGLRVRETVFGKDDLRELVVYWYSMSGYTGTDASRQKLARVERLLSGKPVIGASKIQIVVTVETTRESAEERLEGFLGGFLPVLKRFIPQDREDGRS